MSPYDQYKDLEFKLYIVFLLQITTLIVILLK